MNNYIIIYNTGLKVDLKAKDGVFDIKVNRKVVLRIADSIERLFAYWIYGESSSGDVSSWLRDCWNKDITPMEIDSIISSFKESHPAQEVTNFEFSEIPLYATEENGLALPIPRTYCVISKEDERELMGLLVRFKNYPLPILKNWFCKFRGRYGLDFQKKVGKWADQDEELAVSFLNQHGFNSSLTTNQELAKAIEKEKTNKTGTVIMSLILTVFIIYMFSNHYLISLIITVCIALVVGGVIFIISLIKMFSNK